MAARNETRIERLLTHLRTQRLVAAEQILDQQNIFSTVDSKVFAKDVVSLLVVSVLNEVASFSSRRVLQNDTLVPTNTSNSTSNNDNVIYVKPDAVFGLVLSGFVFFVAYVGAMCLFNVNPPKGFASKPFKFGREM